MTGPGKQVLSTQNTFVCVMATISYFLCAIYPTSVSFIDFPMDFCIYGDIFNAVLIIDKKLLRFKLSKSGQILHVDKTGFPSPGHILMQYVQRRCNLYCQASEQSSNINIINQKLTVDSTSNVTILSGKQSDDMLMQADMLDSTVCL